MSTIPGSLFTYRNELNIDNGNVNSVGLLDGFVRINNPASFNPKRKQYIQGLSATVAKTIPNIFSDGKQFNNRLIRVKRNIADAWTQITLNTGMYSIDDLSAAITSAVASWYTDPLSPALLLSANVTTNQVIITIDSSLLAAGGTQMCVDFTLGNMAQTLGFTTLAYTSDGLHSSQVFPKVDAQGISIDVYLDITMLRKINGNTSKLLFSIPMSLAYNSTSSSASVFLYPPPGSSPQPLVDYTGPTTMAVYKVEFKKNDGSPLYFQNGSTIEITFIILEI